MLFLLHLIHFFKNGSRIKAWLQRFHSSRLDPNGFNADFDSIHIKTFVLGDLCSSHAHEYYLDLIKRLPALSQQLFPLDEKSFDDIFHLTGGRMLLIEEYIYQALVPAAEANSLPTGTHVITERFDALHTR
jgi:hypothetical protein